MKHDNYYSYFLLTLSKPSYLGMISFSCIAKLVSCDFHNLLECSKYVLHISTNDKVIRGRKDRMEGVGDGEIYCSYRARDVEDVSEFARWKNLTHLKY